LSTNPLALIVLFTEVIRLEEQGWEAIKLCSKAKRPIFKHGGRCLTGPDPPLEKDGEHCGLGL
jgi:hypothetical protein